jgi:hypothetical protein
MLPQPLFFFGLYLLWGFQLVQALLSACLTRDHLFVIAAAKICQRIVEPKSETVRRI